MFAPFLFYMIPKSTFEVIDTTKDAPPLVFNTEYYEAEHGKAPAPNKKGVYRFHPPLHLGKRPIEFHDMSFAEAKKQAIEWIGERGSYGEFVLAP